MLTLGDIISIPLHAKVAFGDDREAGRQYTSPLPLRLG
jgi:hypothetical protein